MRYLLMVGCVLSLAQARANAPDSLSLKDKGQINKLAELVQKEYVNVLRAIASYSAESESDASDVEDLLKGVCEGESRFFTGPNAIIQDNVDPDLRPGSSSLNRKVAEYGNDLFMYFRGEGDDPINMKLLAKAEPTIGQQVYTKLLYEITFTGKHKEKTTPYATQKRVMQLIAEPKGEGDWRVFIASDDYYDVAQGFVEYKVEKDIADAESSGASLSPELAAYKASMEIAERAAERERAEKKQKYDRALDAGKLAVAAEDFDDAIDLYKQAQMIDPMSIEPLVMIKGAQKARDAKQARLRKEFDEQLDKGTKLFDIKEYDRSLEAYQRAARIMPEDPRCTSMIDTLKARIQAKADRENAFLVGNYAASLASTKELLKKRKDDPELLTLLAKTHRAMNKNSDALDNVNKALEKDPNLAEALYLRARINETSPIEAHQRAAEEDFNRLKSRDRWNMEYVHRIAGMKCFMQRNCRSASDILKASLEEAPTNAGTYYMLGCVHGFGYMGQLNELENSIAFLDKSIALDSTCAKCYLERGISLLMQDSVAAAQRSVEQARRLKLPPEQGLRAAKMAADNFKEADDLKNAGKSAMAARYYASATVLRPDTAGYWAARAQNLMLIPRYEEAVRVWDAYLEKSDGDYLGRMARAECLLHLRRFDEVEQEVQRVKRNDLKGTFTARNSLLGGQACFMKGDLICADGYLKEALKKDGANPKVLSMLARIAFERKDYKLAEEYAEGAIEKYAKAEGKDKGDPENFFTLGLIQQQLGKAKKSLDSFDQAKYWGYERNPVLKQKGRSWMLVGEWKAAIAELRELLLNADDVEASRWKAECHLKEGQFDEGLRDLITVQEKHPEMRESPEFLAQIGLFYTLTGSQREAGEALDAAYRADPDYMETLLARVAYFWKGSRQEEAVKELSELVRKGLEEKSLKERPVLKEIVASPLWKNRAK